MDTPRPQSSKSSHFKYLFLFLQTLSERHRRLTPKCFRTEVSLISVLINTHISYSSIRCSHCGVGRLQVTWESSMEMWESGRMQGPRLAVSLCMSQINVCGVAGWCFLQILSILQFPGPPILIISVHQCFTPTTLWEVFLKETLITFLYTSTNFLKNIYTSSFEAPILFSWNRK